MEDMVWPVGSIINTIMTQFLFTNKRIALKTILKFTLKQFLHASLQTSSSGSVLFELAKVIVLKIIN